MKIYCGNSGCTRSTHSMVLKLGMKGVKKDQRWFCSHRCYKNFHADNLIAAKRSGTGPGAETGPEFNRMARRLKLGLLLVGNNLITKEQLTLALEQKSGSMKKLGEILVDLHMITPRQLKAALSMQSGLTPGNLDVHSKLKLKKEIPFKLIHEFHFVVFEYDEQDRTIAVALYDCDNIDYVEHYFSKLFPRHAVTYFLEDRTLILNLISTNYPEEKFNLDLEEQLSPVAGRRESGNMETTVLQLVEFLNQFTGTPVKVDSLDRSVWLKNETDSLKIDVYISHKDNPGTLPWQISVDSDEVV